MDELTERKIRDLRLKLLMVDKELNASQHKTNLGAMLRAGNPTQMARAADRDRKRLEEKRDKLMEQLAALEPTAAPEAKPVPAASAMPVKKPAAKKTAAPVKAATKSKPKNPPERTA